MDDQNNPTPTPNPAPVMPEPASPQGEQGEPTFTPPAAESQKCVTCGNSASAGNCMACGQGEVSCTCTPTGGTPTGGSMPPPVGGEPAPVV